MPDTRVLAYFMHEHEQSAAAGMLRNAEITDSYVIGDIDTTQIDALRAKGLVVQDLKTVEPVTADAAPAVETPGVTAAAPPALRRARRAARGPRAPRVAIDRPTFHVVQMAGPVLPRHRGALDALGVTLKEHIGDRAYVAKLTAAQATAVESQDFVAEVALYDEADTVLASGATAEPPAPVAGAVSIRTYDALLHDAAELEQTRTAIAAMGVLISGAKGRKVRFHVLDSVAAATAEAVRALGPVERVDPYVEPTLHNDVARVLLGLDSPANPATGMTEQGAGQIIAIADTGLDSAHPDFQGRIVEAVALGRPNDSSDPHGHGTHVAGSVLGDGAANSGQFRGTAPSARLYFQSMLDAERQASAGCRSTSRICSSRRIRRTRAFHNNSWGSVAAARVHDELAGSRCLRGEAPRHAVVISAGNDGQCGGSASTRSPVRRLALDRLARVVQERADGGRVAIEPDLGRDSTLTVRRAPGRPTFPMPPIARPESPVPRTRSPVSAAAGPAPTGASSRTSWPRAPTSCRQGQRRRRCRTSGDLGRPRPTRTWAAPAWRRRWSPAALRWCGSTT